MNSELRSSVDSINRLVNQFLYLEAEVSCLDKNNITISLSEDIMYFYNFKVHFKDVFAVSINMYFKINTKKDLIFIEFNDEVYDINVRNRIEIGNEIFRISNKDNLLFFIACKGLELEIIN